MADKFLNQLPTAGALTGAELVLVMQGGNTEQTTTGGLLVQPNGVALLNTIAAGGTISGTVITGSTNLNSTAIFAVSVTDSTSNAKFSSTGSGGTAGAQGIIGGSLQVTLGFAANGNTPQAKASINAACIDLPTAVALLNQIRAALIANGICQ